MNLSAFKALSLLGALLLFSTLLAACGGGGGGSSRDDQSGAQPVAADDSATDGAPVVQPNIIVFLTDDQRFDTVSGMTNLQGLAAEGVRFSSAYVTTPACSPVRASLLSGGFYAHNTGVLGNAGPDGGWDAFDETRNWSLTLQRAGIRTGFVGKDMNGYKAMRPGVDPEVPPGWNYFVATAPRDYKRSWSDSLFIDSVVGENPTVTRGSVDEYITDYQTRRAIDFVQRDDGKPFMLLLSYNAPHTPAFAAPGDRGVNGNFVYSGRAFAEADMSDKAPLARERAAESFLGSDLFGVPGNQLDSLIAVDRSIAAVVQAVRDAGHAENTVYVFMSDNGLFWNEHNYVAKSAPYEEAARVPMMIFGEPVAAAQHDGLVAANLDVPATVNDLLGIEAMTDGVSLASVLEGDAEPVREQVFLESFSDYLTLKFVWSAVISKNNAGYWKFVRWRDGNTELYDLVADPFEESSAHLAPGNADRLARMSEELAGFDNIAVLDGSLPDGTAGQPYAHQLRAGAGATHDPELAVEWAVVDGELPDGLTLNRKSGQITGVPQESGDWEIAIRVTRDSLSPYSGQPVGHSAEFSISIAE